MTTHTRIEDTGAAERIMTHTPDTQRGADGERLCDNPACNRTATPEEATLFWLYIRGRSNPLWFCSWVCVHAFAEPMTRSSQREVEVT